MSATHGAVLSRGAPGMFHGRFSLFAQELCKANRAEKGDRTALNIDELLIAECVQRPRKSFTHQAEFLRQKVLRHLKLDPLRFVAVRVGTMLNQPACQA